MKNFSTWPDDAGKGNGRMAAIQWPFQHGQWMNEKLWKMNDWLHLTCHFRNPHVCAEGVSKGGLRLGPGALRDIALNGNDKIKTIVNLCSDPLCQWYHFWNEFVMFKGKLTLLLKFGSSCDSHVTTRHRGLSNSTTTAICTDGAVKGIGNAQSLSKSQVQTRAIQKFLENGYTKSDYIMVGHSRDSTVLQVMHSW